MDPAIHQPRDSDEYYFHEGCHILELWNAADDPQVSIARARVAPGVTTRWHSLRGVTERYVILEGEGQVEVGELAACRIGPAAITVIPPGCRQRISNTGKTDLVFLAVCSPRFTPDIYQPLDEHGR